MNLTPIKPGDLVYIDGTQAKGSDGLAASVRPYYALVVGRENGHLECVRTDVPPGKQRAFKVRARLVVSHWRKSKASS